MENIFDKALEEDARTEAMYQRIINATGEKLENERPEAERQRDRAYKEYTAALIASALEE